MASALLIKSHEYKLLGENGDISEPFLVEQKPVVVKAKEFREDIALLRALAILAVLGYHFKPDIFAWGFVGVDVFFVISGYLIMTILQRSSGGPQKVIANFYYRRLKRICPLYFLVMFLAGFCTMFVYTAIWAERYYGHYLQSVLFFLNLKMLASDGDYFAEDTAKMPFLHSWSLAVEIQFYFVAPIIFFVSKLKIKELRFGPIILFGLLVLSVLYQFSSSSIMAFYHPFSRLWQFLVGMLSAFYSNKSQTEGEDKRMDIVSSILIASVLVVFIPFTPHLSPPNFVQLIVTITSGAFMLTSSFGTINWGMFGLGYIATISYSLYLVHFPVLRFSEYLAELNEFQYVHLIALVVTVALSILLHHLYEKPLSTETKMNVLCECLKYLSLSILIALQWDSVVQSGGCVSKAAIGANAKFTHSMYVLEGGMFADDGFGRQRVFGHYQYKNGTGDHKVVVVGNSWSAQQAHIVRKILPESYTDTMDLFSWPSYSVVFHNPTNARLSNMTEFFWNYIERSKPDIVFILMRYHNYRPWSLNDFNPFLGKENDEVYKRYLKVVNRLSKFAEHIFIETHQPFYCPLEEHDFLNHFMDMLEKGKNMEKANQQFDADAFDNSPVQQRLEALVEDCPKCHLLNVSGVFINRPKKRVVTYDSKTMLAYLDNECHLTASGLKMIEAPFKRRVKEVLKIKTE